MGLSKNQETLREIALNRSCSRYQPCPICFKCMLKASHLFIECQNCEIPICSHNEKARNWMIKRENFADPFIKFRDSKFKED